MATPQETAARLKDLPLDQARDALTELARSYDGKDAATLDALAAGCAGKEEAMYAHLLGKLGAPTLKWSGAFADIAARLHPLNALPALKDRAMARELPPERRRQAIDAIARIQDKAAAAALKEIAEKGPEDTRAHAAGK